MTGIGKTVIQRSLGHLASFPTISPLIKSLVRALKLPQSLAQRIPVVKTFQCKVGSRSYLYTSSMYDGLGRLLYWYGFDNYERETMDVFQRIIKGASDFIDVGANTGIFTLAANSYCPGVNTHAFEPVRSVFDALSFHIKTNGLSETTILNRLALSDRNGEFSFHVPYDSISNASFDLTGFRNVPGQIEQVKCTTLDDYVVSRKIRKVNVMKIDVEGFEHLVFEGGKNILARDMPAVLCECLPGCKTDAIAGILYPLGYKYYMLTDKGPVQKNHIQPDEDGKFLNYLFTTESNYRRCFP